MKVSEMRGAARRVGLLGRVAAWLAFALWLGSSYACAAAAEPEHSAIDVLHYAARLDPDLQGKSLHGRVTVTLVLTRDDERTLSFDAGRLEIDAVNERRLAMAFERQEGKLLIRLPKPSTAGESHEIEIQYHGAPRFGLEFHPENNELYTIFSTSQWLVCIDAPSERATFDLEIVLPTGFKSVGNGNAGPTSPLPGDRESHRWHQGVAVPSYVYGFAAGRYVEVEQHGAGVQLRNLATHFTPEQLRRIFVDSEDMLRYFGKRAGIRYRGRYSQALVAETIGQELAGFALMSEDYGREVLADPTAESLIAHEIAHQWWGNMVTCRDWNNFWLNEGFATFMTAAYLQHRFGEAEYRRRVDGWRTRIEKLRAAGSDRPLVFARWIKPTSDDRAVVYQKGAYVLHLLRQELGERVFWRGIRAYTREHYGSSVSSADFQRAMERASRRDLNGFFGRWVFGKSD